MANAQELSGRQIERRAQQMTKRLDSITAATLRSVAPGFGVLAGAITTGEVLKYADAWTKAKNSLAVAGVTGRKQAALLDELYESAQRNAAPIGALTSLYGSAAQAQGELGASSASLVKFTDGVAVALKVAGKSSTEASGALMQLGQLLGSARVQAEEFNSINEGARPILIAVANGIDEAGGSVSKLKALVNDGKVSNKQFFDGFLKGMPAIQAMAASSTQTLEQGWTKVDNALTRYIGRQDQSLGATSMLSKGLNALADDFDNIADVTLKVAAVIAAALVGRAVGGLIVKLIAAGVEVKKLVAALRGLQGATALMSFSSAAGPLGAALGIAAAATIYFSSSARAAGSNTDGRRLGRGLGRGQRPDPPCHHRPRGARARAGLRHRRHCGLRGHHAVSKHQCAGERQRHRL
ncbi:tape measure protein [Methylopila musalis]|uniref:Tape measure protein n=1 Tax=Methylopila musalis TaxID=1134781 RepID=A0ABW3Z4M2_9HYPH